MTSLGFDTVIVSNRQYDRDSILGLFDTLSPYDVRNFIFLSDFDITVNSFSLEAERIKGFKEFLKPLAPRGIHTFVYYNAIFYEGLVHNKEFKRLYALKKKSSLFIEYPRLDKPTYERLATDINYMLYRQGAHPLCTRFDAIMETSDKDVCRHLLACNGFSFGFDLNYILSPENKSLIAEIVKNKTLFLPTITKDISQYNDVIIRAQALCDSIGKKEYYQLCASINKASSMLGI